MVESTNAELVLTQEGYDRLAAEHQELITVKRDEIGARLKEAISYGDISENAEYDAAKNEQAEIENRITELEDMMRRARILKDEEVRGDVVSIGVTVRVKNEETKEEATFSIVGATEADPFSGKITSESAVGKALIGGKTGDTVQVEIPDGMITYTILEISKTDQKKN